MLSRTRTCGAPSGEWSTSGPWTVYVMVRRIYVHTYTYIHVYIYICLNICIFTYIYIYEYTYTYMYMQIYSYTHTPVAHRLEKCRPLVQYVLWRAEFTFTYTYIYTWMNVDMYWYMFLHIDKFIFIYTFVYIHIHILSYAYILSHKHSCSALSKELPTGVPRTACALVRRICLQNVCILAYMYGYTYIHLHMYIPTYTYIYMQMYPDTHTPVARGLANWRPEVRVRYVVWCAERPRPHEWAVDWWDMTHSYATWLSVAYGT